MKQKTEKREETQQHNEETQQHSEETTRHVKLEKKHLRLQGSDNYPASGIGMKINPRASYYCNVTMQTVLPLSYSKNGTKLLHIQSPARDTEAMLNTLLGVVL